MTVAAALGFLAAVPPGTGPAPRQHVVEIRGMKFSPSVLKVHQGDTVTWVNRDMVPHTATAGKGAVLSTGTILGGDSASVVIVIAGEHEYICQLHPVMTGRVVVE